MTRKEWGGARKGAGRAPLEKSERKQGAKIYLTETVKEDILIYGDGVTFSESALELIIAEINRRKDSNETEE